MAETLLEKAKRLGIQPVATPTETLQQKAERLGIKPAGMTSKGLFPTATPTRPNLQTLKDEAAISEAESKKANSVMGMTKNFGKALVSNLASSEVGLGKAFGEAIAAPKVIDAVSTAEQNATDIQVNLLKQIRANKAIGKDTTRLEKAYNELTGKKINTSDYIAENIPNSQQSTLKTIGQIGGTALDVLSAGTYSKASLPVKANLTKEALKDSFKITSKIKPSLIPKPTANFFSRETGKDLLKGGGVGYAYDVSQGLQNEKKNPLTPGFGTLLGVGIPLVGRGGPALKKTLTPKSDEIMNRVARLTPSDANKFEKMTGKTHGKYLEETGNFGRPEEIIKKESEKFTQSLNQVDDELAKLPGRHKAAPLDMVLDDLLAREKRIGVPGNDSSKVIELYNKNKQGGLEMGEANWVKRKYERDVKLGYLKENNTEGVERATRLDDHLREWQFKKADDLGLKNLPEMNKQTQTSKFLIDKLGKQMIGKTGNNALTLTDWIMLSGGDPTAVGAFLAKKTLTNNGFLAGVAKFVSKNAPKGAIEPIIGTRSGLPATIPGVDYRTAIEMPPPVKKIVPSMEAPAPKIFNQSRIDSQLKLPAPQKNSAQGLPFRLPQSIRETNLGLDEVRNTINPQNNQKVQLPKAPKPVKINKALPNSIVKASRGQISSAEKGTMRDFMDFVAGEYKPHSEQAKKNLLADAQDIAVKYGFKTAFNSDKSLSTAFGKFLKSVNFNK